MKTLSALLSAVVLTAIASTASANLIVNGGFEDPVTYDGPPFVGSWEGFSGSASAGAGNSAAMPRTGAQALDVAIFGEANTFAGVFQDVDGLIAGQTTLFSGWHLSLGDVGGIEIRIEWRDSVTDTEIARTANLTPIIGNSYEEFSLSAIVPTGADTARVVYVLQSFGAGPNQQVFVDDVSFVVDALVPEPTTLGLIGLGGLMLFRLRRRAG